MTGRLDTGKQDKIISTGSEEIDRCIGGGIPYGTLMLIEGGEASGKSTLVQQFLWGALISEEDVALYTTENTVRSLLRQMDSLGLNVTDYFLTNHLRIHPISVSLDSVEPDVLFKTLSEHMGAQRNCRATIIDSLTTFVSRAGGDQILDFFNRCKSLCDAGQVVICTVHDGAFDNDILTRVRSVCDAYLRLQTTRTGSKLVKTIEVAKIKGGDSNTGNISAFDIEPGLGIRIVPISTARA